MPRSRDRIGQSAIQSTRIPAYPGAWYTTTHSLAAWRQDIARSISPIPNPGTRSDREEPPAKRKRGKTYPIVFRSTIEEMIQIDNYITIIGFTDHSRVTRFTPP
ncbi:hypothetical protein AFLA_006770 [Aspergillus flavus NRRL3357]|nr:hypothetical protein AFLA_006770 [Aspergillus flavus NRRL3357]